MLTQMLSPAEKETAEEFKKYAPYIQSYLDVNCNKHKSKLEIFCPHSECMADNKFLLCLLCYREHPKEHMPSIIPYQTVFAPDLFQDLNELIAEQQTRTYRAIKAHPTAFQNLEAIYNDIQKEVITMLNASKERVKLSLILKINSAKNDKMDWIKAKTETRASLKEIMNYTFEKVKIEDLKNYLQKFGEVHDQVINIKQRNQELKAAGKSNSGPLKKVKLQMDLVSKIKEAISNAISSNEALLLPDDDTNEENEDAFNPYQSGFSYLLGSTANNSSLQGTSALGMRVVTK